VNGPFIDVYLSPLCGPFSRLRFSISGQDGEYDDDVSISPAAQHGSITRAESDNGNGAYGDGTVNVTF
jgi:hypothetical protein